MQAFQELGGQASLGEISEKTGIAVNGLSQTLRLVPWHWRIIQPGKRGRLQRDTILSIVDVTGLSPVTVLEFWEGEEDPVEIEGFVEKESDNDMLEVFIPTQCETITVHKKHVIAHDSDTLI